MKKVLVVCHANVSRSPMMAGILSKLLVGIAHVESAGVNADWAGIPATKTAIAIMSEEGIDIRGHVSRFVGNLDLEGFHHIICVGSLERSFVETQLEPGHSIVFHIPLESDGGVPDPFRQGEAAHREWVKLLKGELERIAHTIQTAPVVGA